MTNEELDKARVDEAMRLWDGSKGSLAVIAARLAREGWTPPVAIDPDIAEAEAIWFEGKSSFDLVLTGIKRGRALATAEAKPGMVWVKHDGSEIRPVSVDQYVWVRSFGYPPYAAKARNIAWQGCSHYAIIPQPEDVA